MTSLLIIASVVLRNALARRESALGRGNQKKSFQPETFLIRDRNCRRIEQAFSKQRCGGGAATK
jgi:hypothetical protein